MFLLMYDTGDRVVEKMFHDCLYYGAGFTSSPEVYGQSKDLYGKYMPLLSKLYGRRWVFDENPIELPAGFKGNVFISREGNLTASIVGGMGRCAQRRSRPETVSINSKEVRKVGRVMLHEPGEKPLSVKFSKKGENLKFDLRGGTVAAVAELLQD